MFGDTEVPMDIIKESLSVLLLVIGSVAPRFVRLLLHGSSGKNEHNTEPDGFLFGNSTEEDELDHHEMERTGSSKLLLLQERAGCIIHMVAGLGFEWALIPVLSMGVNINFLDINGWTALHWAAKHGREKMVQSRLLLGH
ncbi:hypothetical protein MLD38_040363 [Melastoma candidum]|uniref:Uncharacterized protein n=1 Tax=Melastoma candidum TaxID=119954 RepID=A0ACB9L5S1_9MYRT|nr:hypothetical protein MLD38_040363 [Melastoma candidum]